MRADPNGTPTEQRRAACGWRSATEVNSSHSVLLSARCADCESAEWTDARTPRLRCGRHGFATSRWSRCGDWAAKPADPTPEQRAANRDAEVRAILRTLADSTLCSSQRSDLKARLVELRLPAEGAA
jgi:hypothetical protein